MLVRSSHLDIFFQCHDKQCEQFLTLSSNCALQLQPKVKEKICRRPNFVRKGGFLVVEGVLRPYCWPRHC